MRPDIYKGLISYLKEFRPLLWRQDIHRRALKWKPGTGMLSGHSWETDWTRETAFVCGPMRRQLQEPEQQRPGRRSRAPAVGTEGAGIQDRLRRWNREFSVLNIHVMQKVKSEMMATFPPGAKCVSDVSIHKTKHLKKTTGRWRKGLGKGLRQRQ